MSAFKTAVVGTVVLLLISLLIAPQALAAVAGTVSRWVGDMLVFDGTSGNDAFKFDVNGLRGHFGTGVNDYIESDGTNLFTPGAFQAANSITNGDLLNPQTTDPAIPAPDAGVLLWQSKPQANVPAMFQYVSDGNLGFKIPEAAGSYFTNGVNGGTKLECTFPVNWAASTWYTFNHGTIQQIGTAATVAWSNASYLGRVPTIQANSAGATNSSAGIVMGTGTQKNAWRGNAAGAGGFLIWLGFALTDTKAASRTWVGLFETAAVLSAAANPSAATNTVYVGCDSGDTNLGVCSNDASGTATSNTLGASFPCNTDGATYDVWFWAKPNGSAIDYYVERLDSAASAQGSITSDLPDNTILLNWQAILNTGPTTATAVQIRNRGVCTIANF